MAVTISPLPNNLPGLTPMEKIHDAINRCTSGLDSNDASLFRSAFTHDAIFNLNGTEMVGYSAIEANCYAQIAKLDTTHFVTGVRVHLVSDREAKVTASALAQHYLLGKGLVDDTRNLMSGCLYAFDVVREDENERKDKGNVDEGNGVWRIKRWDLKLVWKQGDMSVVNGGQ